MTPPLTLFRYMTRRMIVSVLALYVALAALIFLIDFIESLRFAGKVPAAGFIFALKLTLLRTPGLTQSLMPFVFLFAAMWMFAQLNQRSELAVMRSAGLSIWRLIGPSALCAAFAGLLLILVLDPVSTYFASEAEQAKNEIRNKSSSRVRIFGDGLWLRHRDIDATLLLNADSVDEAAGVLNDVTVWRVGIDNAFLERIDAPTAVLSGRTIELRQARIRGAEDKLPQRTPFFMVPSTLTAADFREGSPAPDMISVWNLPRYVLVAKAAGLPTLRYDLRFHDLCATPLKLLAMVLIAGMFSFRPTRQGGGLQLALLAIGTGFILYVMTEIANAAAESGAAPVMLAAWTPALVATTVAVTGLLGLEDG